MLQGSHLFEIQASFKTPETLEMALSAHAPDRTEQINLAEGVTLTPLFLSSRTSNAVGTPELLAFTVTVSSSVAGKVVAELIYRWFTKAKAERLRFEKTEVLIQDGSERSVRIISEIVDKGPRE